MCAVSSLLKLNVTPSAAFLSDEQLETSKHVTCNRTRQRKVAHSHTWEAGARVCLTHKVLKQRIHICQYICQSIHICQSTNQLIDKSFQLECEYFSCNLLQELELFPYSITLKLCRLLGTHLSILPEVQEPFPTVMIIYLLAPLFWVLFLWMPCCICYAKAKEPHVTNETISWAVCHGSLPLRRTVCTICCCLPIYMCVCALAPGVRGKNVCVREEKEDSVKEAERVSLCLLSSFIITTCQLIPLYSALMEPALLLIPSVQILLQSFMQITRVRLPLCTFAICCDSQMNFSVSFQSRSTAWLNGPDVRRKPPVKYVALSIVCSHSALLLILDCIERLYHQSQL